MDIDLILSTGSFILNTVLMSGFIIPQVQKLKDIKDELINFDLTYAPVDLPLLVVPTIV